MRAVVQRVKEAHVNVDGRIVGAISHGLLVLLGVGEGDTEEDGRYLAEKISNLRVFPDDQGKMNLSIKDSGGEILAVSQFTLYGDCRKGRRPSFSSAAHPEVANQLYLNFVEVLRNHGLKVETGVFQAHMEVGLVNDGPVTLIVSSGGEF
ncbi:MAG TPA: D-tyrosyl-tRNA(Tyr) deacylase [Firmicutes bacterium]|nr:D-tyrosyl-tRNA(Tyr) deacylase [Bacillota bacterium]